MLFLPLSALLLLLPPLYFVHGVSGGSRVKSSEETLIGSDFSLSTSSCPSASSSSSLFVVLASRFSWAHAAGLELECPRKYFRVDAIRRRKNPSLDFCTFFQPARPSPLTVDRPFPFPFRCRRPSSMWSSTMKFFVAPLSSSVRRRFDFCFQCNLYNYDSYL